MSVEEELFAIRVELKGQREAVAGIKDVVTAEKELTSQTGKTGVAAEKAEKKTSRLGAAFAGLGSKAKWALGFLGVGGVFALQNAVHETENLALATSGLSRNFGFSTNVASRWAAVMHSREVDPKALSMAFGTLSSKMVEAGRKGGTTLTSFHQLGLTQEEVKHGASDFEWGLMRVAKALGEEEGGSKRATAAKALLGKGFQTLTPLFSEGAEGLKEQLHWADEYGVTLNTTTKEGLMEMVSGQRELKVASLGVQLALTKALMPAIRGGEDQVKEFIKTLNDPHLSAEEKIDRIEKQFLGLEDTLIEIVSDALPRIAEHGGELGVKLAGALWHGFEESDLEGKLVISAWLLHSMGGDRAILSAGGAIGKRLVGGIGTAFANRFPVLTILLEDAFRGAGQLSGKAFTAGAVLGLVIGIPLLAWQIEKELPAGTKVAIRRWAIGAGEWFVNGLINVVNKGIGLINDAMNNANVFSFLGVEAPQIGEIGGVNFEPGLERQEHEAKQHRKEGLIDGPGGKPVKPFDPKKHHSVPGQRLPSSAPRHGGRVLQLHTHLHVDGRELAEVVQHHVLADEALS